MADQKAVVGLLLTWQMAESFWFLGQIFSGGLDLRGTAVYLFYEANLLALFAMFLLRRLGDTSRARAANLPVQELLSFDIVKQVVPFMSVGLATGVGLALAYSLQGFALTLPAYPVITQNLLEIVPSETFIFIFFLPYLLPDYLGVPSFIWAVIYAGVFHFFAYSADPLEIGFAVLLFSLWYVMYRMGEHIDPRTGRRRGFAFLGLGAVLAMHFMINVFAAAAHPASLVLPGGTVLGPFVLAPFIPALGSMLAWRASRGRAARSS